MLRIPDHHLTPRFDDMASGGLLQEHHILYGLQTEITFQKGAFFCRPINCNSSDDLLNCLQNGTYNQFPLIEMPSELQPVLDGRTLGIYKDDSPEEVKRKLFEYNSKTTFVIRQLAKEFELGAKIPEAWKLVANDVPHEFSLYESLTLKPKAAIHYLLTGIRCEILKEDFKKRDIIFNPTCSLENFMYVGNNTLCGSGSPREIIEVDEFLLLYDLMNFLFSSYVYRDEEPSSFLFLTWKDEDIMNLPGMRSVYKYADLNALRKTLSTLYMYVSEFYTMVLRIEPEDESVIKDDSDLTIIRKLFQMISKLESYAMNF